MTDTAHERGLAPLHRISRAAGAGASVSVAHSTGVLDRLGSGAASASEVAAACGLDERATTLLLGALAEIEVVMRREDDRYELHLPADVLGILVDLWDALGPFLATGVPRRRVDEAGQAGAAYASLASALGDVGGAVVAHVADVIGDPGRRLLDVAAGVVPWSCELATRHPRCELTAVDLPDVAVATEAALASAGLGDRARVVPGDLFTVAVDGTFDTVLVANVCRLFGEDRVRRLLGRAAAWTAPGGRVVVIDVLPDVDRPGDDSIGLYALGLALRTGTGGVHSFSDYAAWLYDAGFVHIEIERLGQPELSMIRATRPG